MIFADVAPRPTRRHGEEDKSHRLSRLAAVKPRSMTDAYALGACVIAPRFVAAAGVAYEESTVATSARRVHHSQRYLRYEAFRRKAAARSHIQTMLGFKGMRCGRYEIAISATARLRDELLVSSCKQPPRDVQWRLTIDSGADQLVSGTLRPKSEVVACCEMK